MKQWKSYGLIVNEIEDDMVCLLLLLASSHMTSSMHSCKGEVSSRFYISSCLLRGIRERDKVCPPLLSDRPLHLLDPLLRSKGGHYRICVATVEHDLIAFAPE
jgi:hypothetical protein